MAEGGWTPPRRSPRSQWPTSPSSSSGSSSSRSPEGRALSPRIPDLGRVQFNPHPKDSWIWPDLLAQTRGAYKDFKDKNNVRIGSDDKYMAKMDEYERILKNSDDKEEKERIRLKLRHLSDFIDQITHLDEEGSPGPTGSDYSDSGSSGSSDNGGPMNERRYREYMERRKLGDRPTPRVKLYQQILDTIDQVKKDFPFRRTERLSRMHDFWEQLINMGADIPGAFYWHDKLEALSKVLLDPSKNEYAKMMAYKDLMDFSEFMAAQIVRDQSHLESNEDRQAANRLREEMLGGRERAAEHDLENMMDQLADNPGNRILNRGVSSPSRFQRPEYAIFNPPVPQNTPQKPEAFRHREYLRRLAFSQGPTHRRNEKFRDWGGYRATDVEWEGGNSPSPSPTRQSPAVSPGTDLFAKDYNQLYMEGTQYLNYIKRNVTVKPREIEGWEEVLEDAYRTLFETPHRQDTEVTRLMYMNELRSLVDHLRELATPSPKGYNFYSPITPPAPSPGVSPYGGQAASSMTEEQIQNVSDLLDRSIPDECFPRQPPQPPQPPHGSRSPSPNIRRRLF